MKMLLRHPKYGDAELYSNVSKPVVVVNVICLSCVMPGILQRTIEMIRS